MKIGTTKYFTNRTQWRRWLSKNHKTAKEIWLIYYRKDSGKPRIPYNDAVEEALCYGWIDSTIKSIDAERFAQRFTPRRSTSQLSQMNRERIRVLIANKKMTRAGLAAVAHVFDPATDKPGPAAVSPDVLKRLRADKKAWKHFQNLPEEYKRIRIAYIKSQRAHGEEQFEAALRNFITKTAENKRFGFVKGEDV